MAVIDKHYPNRVKNKAIEFNIYDGEVVAKIEVKDPADRYIDIEDYCVALEVQALHNCCGVVEIGKFNGHPASPLDEAVLALALDRDHEGFAAAIATTAVRPGVKNDPIEAQLRRIGFEPVCKGFNHNHGENNVTLWAYQITSARTKPRA